MALNCVKCKYAKKDSVNFIYCTQVKRFVQTNNHKTYLYYCCPLKRKVIRGK